MREVLLETKHLKKYFRTSRGNLHAVDDVSLQFYKGETLGVVGESGCGKSTLGRTILTLVEPTSGEILYKGTDIAGYGKAETKQMRRHLQMIFQDPYASLDPRMTVSEIIAEPIYINKTISNRQEIQKKVRELMDTVGLSARLANAYPHELDGGRRQRIGIAKALSLSPEFIVCDEPVSALDVSIQAQILNLMLDLQEDIGLTYMFVTHDLSVVKMISNEIVVMYLGKCVEIAASQELFDHPMHPYTRALLSAIPIPDLNYRNKKREILKGEVVSPIDPAPGCRFAPRCRYVCERCTQKDVELQELAPGHLVACCRADEIKGGTADAYKADPVRETV